MNKDIRLSTGFWQHPKTKKTVKKLGLEGIQALQVLWLWVAINRPDGNLSGMDWEDIELAADWKGEEKAFFTFCVGDEGSPVWIDTTSDGDFVLHDWVEHNPWQAEAEDRSNASRFVNLAKINKPIYELLKKKGIRGLTKEEFERYKKEQVLIDIPQTIEASDNLDDGTAPPRGSVYVVEALPLGTECNPLAKRPSPSPSPQPKEKNTQHTSNSTLPCARDSMGHKKRVCVNAYDSLGTTYANASLSLGKTHKEISSTLRGVDTREKPAKTMSPSKGTPEWSNFLCCYEVYPVQKNQEGAWNVWCELSQRGILDPTAYIRDKIVEMKTYDSQWIAGYAPYMENWLKKKGWNDKPHIKPDLAQKHAIPVFTPKTPEQMAREKQEAEAFLARRREESRKENAKILERRRQEESRKKQQKEQGVLPKVRPRETEKKEQ